MQTSRAKWAVALAAHGLVTACSVAALTAGDGTRSGTVDAGIAADAGPGVDALEAAAIDTLAPDGSDGLADPDAADVLVDAQPPRVDADAAEVGPPPSCALDVPPSGLVGIENLSNLRYLEVPVTPTPGSDANAALAWGTVLDVTSFTGASNQLWSLQAVGDDSGTYRIVNDLSSACIDVIGGSTADGTELQQYGCYPQSNQRFWVCASDGGAVQIVGQGSGKCLTSVGNKDQAPVYIQECSSSTTQAWILAQ